MANENDKTVLYFHGYHIQVYKGIQPIAGVITAPLKIDETPESF